MLDDLAYALADRVSHRWWRVRRRELAVYDRLGVAWFARRFVNGGSHGARNVPFFRRQEGDRRRRLERFERFARGVEAKHLSGLAACSSVPLATWALGHEWIATGLALVNLVGHGYPIMSMRWARARAHELLRRGGTAEPRPPGSIPATLA